ncbi:MAG: response regulator [Deltaproteobacteria bacterium]|nr:response regulator [Deltaproteobacteria bacterium]
MKSDKYHVLLVDDSPMILKVLGDQLVKNGYLVTLCESAEEALEVFQEKEFDLVLADIILPGMSGLNMLKLMKDSKPGIDVIVISSTSSSYTTIRALRLGAYDYLVKPIDDENILSNVVKRALEKKELKQQNERLVADLSVKNRELQEALDMMKTTNRLCSMLSSTTDVASILRILVEKAVEQLNAEKGYLLLLDKSGSHFSIKISVGINHETVKQFKLPCERGISGLVASKNKPLRIDAGNTSKYINYIREEDQNGDLFSGNACISFPLRIKDKVAGVVNVCGRKGGGSFSDTECEFIALLANHAAIAVNNAGQFYQMKKNI